MGLEYRTLKWVQSQLQYRMMTSDWSVTKIRSVSNKYGVKILDEKIALYEVLSGKPPVQLFDLADENVLDEIWSFISEVEK